MGASPLLLDFSEMVADLQGGFALQTVLDA
jgi:hypothetical protein